MKQFWKVGGKVALAALLGLGWTWTGLLKDFRLVDDEQRIIILVFVTGAFLVQQIITSLPSGTDRGDVEARRPLLTTFLRGVLTSYYAKLKEITDQADQPAVRANVMLPTSKWKGLFGAKLRMYYMACPPGLVFSADEQSASWKRKEGTCGWAWAQGDTTIFDADKPELAGPAKRMKKKANVDTRKSVISVPIWRGEQIVGVLSLDSAYGVTHTRFCDTEIAAIAEAGARDLSPFCGVGGVRG